MRARLEERNKAIEKKTQALLQANQDRNRATSELNELKDHMDIKDRKISVLQRKVGYLGNGEKQNDRTYFRTVFPLYFLLIFLRYFYMKPEL